MTKRTVSNLVFALVVTSFISTAHAAFNGVYFIGDSLSDNGNLSFFQTPISMPDADGWDLVPSVPYAPSNNFSNGPVWTDPFAVGLGLSAGPSWGGGNNGAWGGARTGRRSNPLLESPGGLDQSDGWIDFFTPGGGIPAIPAGSLWSVWVGGNDVRDAADLVDPVAAGLAIDNAINNIETIITDLSNAGATHFLVPNVSDVGGTPESVLAGPAFAQNATNLTLDFNNQLANSVANLRGTLGVTIYEADIYGGNQAILSDPTEFGFTNVTDPCLEIGGNGQCGNPDQYLWWDGAHPTAAVHALIAQNALAAVVPIPAALPLFASALILLRVFRKSA